MVLGMIAALVEVERWLFVEPMKQGSPPPHTSARAMDAPGHASNSGRARACERPFHDAPDPQWLDIGLTSPRRAFAADVCTRPVYRVDVKAMISP
jgi:hypothetical protein